MKTNLCLASSFQAHKNYDFIVYDFLSTCNKLEREKKILRLYVCCCTIEQMQCSNPILA